jgi:hypothetical protein
MRHHRVCVLGVSKAQRLACDGEASSFASGYAADFFAAGVAAHEGIGARAEAQPADDRVDVGRVAAV